MKKCFKYYIGLMFKDNAPPYTGYTRQRIKFREGKEGCFENAEAVKFPKNDGSVSFITGFEIYENKLDKNFIMQGEIANYSPTKIENGDTPTFEIGMLWLNKTTFDCMQSMLGGKVNG